jgi:hypothetical protein
LLTTEQNFQSKKNTGKRLLTGQQLSGEQNKIQVNRNQKVVDRSTIIRLINIVDRSTTKRLLTGQQLSGQKKNTGVHVHKPVDLLEQLVAANASQHIEIFTSPDGVNFSNRMNDLVSSNTSRLAACVSDTQRLKFLNPLGKLGQSLLEVNILTVKLVGSILLQHQ